METQINNSSYIKKTALYDFHQALGAKMVEFASWAMPLQYTSSLEEAKYVRNGTGIFDISHMGEIWVSGRDRLAFLEFMTTNSLYHLKEGQMLYSICCNPQGGIIDDIMVYHMGNAYMCITNAANTHAVFMHFLTQSKEFNVTIQDKSQEMSLIALQGKDAEECLNSVFERDFAALDYMHIDRFRFKNNDIIVSRSGYTGEDGFEIYLDNMSGRALWNDILNHDSIDVIPCGLAARDILRLEMGYSLYGVDIDMETNPIEASLGWAVKEKEKKFIGQEAIVAAKKNGVKQKKIAFSMIDRGVPRFGYPIFSAAGTQIGTVRSGLYSPNMDKFIGTAYVQTEETRIGKTWYVGIRDKKYKAIVEKLPFLTPRIKRKESA